MSDFKTPDEIRLRPAPSPWQPIETAPKDGTPVLLWANREEWEHTGFCRVTGYWDGYGWAVYGASGTEPVAGQGRSTGDVHRADQCSPTHWMPLPDGPTNQETEE